eukprot:TRINITY_DN22066_c0_g1_i1.p1 TRINITY_DN22066_c0_g1~~TRINITY_DN22066_c0_g1_i1.p1  ORF type:complete len:509 (+),score=171.29 TRINITY_DN22066_c0_g1_i1:159-1685(+)
MDGGVWSARSPAAAVATAERSGRNVVAAAEQVEWLPLADRVAATELALLSDGRSPLGDPFVLQQQLQDKLAALTGDLEGQRRRLDSIEATLTAVSQRPVRSHSPFSPSPTPGPPPAEASPRSTSLDGAMSAGAAASLSRIAAVESRMAALLAEARLGGSAAVAAAGTPQPPPRPALSARRHGSTPSPVPPAVGRSPSPVPLQGRVASPAAAPAPAAPEPAERGPSAGGGGGAQRRPHRAQLTPPLPKQDCSGWPPPLSAQPAFDWAATVADYAADLRPPPGRHGPSPPRRALSPAGLRAAAEVALVLPSTAARKARTAPPPHMFAAHAAAALSRPKCTPRLPPRAGSPGAVPGLADGRAHSPRRAGGGAVNPAAPVLLPPYGAPPPSHVSPHRFGAEPADADLAEMRARVAAIVQAAAELPVSPRRWPEPLRPPPPRSPPVRAAPPPPRSPPLRRGSTMPPPCRAADARPEVFPDVCGSPPSGCAARRSARSGSRPARAGLEPRAGQA